MNHFIDLLSGPVWQHLTLALLHTLWQGVLMALLLALALRWISAGRPQVRYLTAFSALLGIVASGLITWSVLDVRAEISETRLAAAGTAAPVENQIKIDVVSSRRLTAAEGEELYRSAAAGRRLDRRRFPWLPCVAAGWLIGVAAMLLRMIWTILRLRRFTKGPELADPRVRSLLYELRRVLGVAQPIRIVETALAVSPAVMGVLRPILILPVSMMTGLPPEAVRAILAHELAHVRRYDYLLNLVQMAVEAVLFFNPAVWWINRRIRAEREACCDALAAKALGRPLLLAEALTQWAERAVGRSVPVVAPAWSDHGSYALLDRVRRMVVPGYRPPLPVSPWGFLGFLLLGFLVLAGLWRGTSAAVELATRILTPAQRMEKIAEKQKEYAPEPEKENGVVILSGTLRTGDGEPLPEQIQASLYYHRNTTSGVKSILLNHPPEFSVKAPAGKLWMSVPVKGYAPAIVGPLRGKDGDRIKDIDVVLDKGFPLTIRINDDRKRPIAGAVVEPSLVFEDMQTGLQEKFTSGPEGVATIPHVTEHPIRFSIRRKGYQPLDESVTVSRRNTDMAFTMLPAKAVRGTVLMADGRPAAGVKIRYLFKASGNHTFSNSGEPVLAVTDADGRFVLDELDETMTYGLLADAGENGKQWFALSSGDKEPRIRLGPVLSVQGEIRGDLKLLRKDRRGRPVVSFTQSAHFPEMSFSMGLDPREIPVEPAEGGGRFELRALLPGPVSICTADRKVEMTVGPEQPQASVLIDLTKPPPEPPKRQVVLRFKTPDGKTSPRGKIKYSLFAPGMTCMSLPAYVVIENGEARLEAYAPGTLHCSPDELLGYWFAEYPDGKKEIEPGEGPQVIEIPLVPAGAITGQVLDADGAPVTEGIEIGVNYVRKTAQFTSSGNFGNIKTTGQGKFFVSPLPLDGMYFVQATWGHRVQVLEPIRMDAARPTAAVKLRFSPTVGVSGIVLDPDGKPLPQVPLSLDFKDKSSHAVRGWNTSTGRKGRFQFDDLSAGVGEYSLIVQPRRNYRPTRVILPRDGKPITIQLGPGRVLEGRLLEVESGWPIPGVELWAMPDPFREDSLTCHPETITDRQGLFRFSSLGPGKYRIISSSGLHLQNESGKECLYLSDGNSVEIFAIIPDWSKLKPLPPEAKK
ncbi:MAG: hypothetical protein JXB10_09730 [Pirellulales bacterium]|nr:hypothetical protein [Pirellulales bacterium]